MLTIGGDLQRIKSMFKRVLIFRISSSDEIHGSKSRCDRSSKPSSFAEVGMASLMFAEESTGLRTCYGPRRSVIGGLIKSPNRLRWLAHGGIGVPRTTGLMSPIRRYLASLRRTSIPRSSIASLAAKEIRKWVSRLEKMWPGMTSNSLAIALATKSVALPEGTLG